MELRIEATQHFNKALRGEKADGYKLKKAIKSEMLSLDSIIHPGTVCSDVSLGTKEIRLSRVVGTQYKTRGHMFSGDFMPAAEEESEFAGKWISLCEAQMEEGIRDPIKVYEYLNDYYVREGNKRVSVLKYFDAVTIQADVIRVIAPYDENSWKSKIYYAFLEFYNKTQYEDIWFSDGAQFSRMIALMDRFKDLTDYKDYLKTYYVPFRRIYKKIENKYIESVGLTTGDAFLAYCTVFDEEQIQEDLITKRIKEVLNQAVAQMVVEVKNDSEGVFRSSYSLQMLRKMRVAFAFPGSNDHNSWFLDHYRSMLLMNESYGSQMTIGSIEHVMEGDNPYEVLCDFCKKKYDVIFLTDEQMADCGRQCAVDYPKTTFLLCANTAPSYLLPNYYGKTFQTDYLLGLYTAMRFGSNAYGFVTSDRTVQSVGAYRSFEAGIKSIQPGGSVHSVSDEKDLPDDIWVSAYYRSIKNTIDGEDTVNTYVRKKNETNYCAYTYWDWQRFYEKIFVRLIDGSFRKLREIHKGASNMLFFHWGIDTGVIGIKTPDGLETTGGRMIYENIKNDIAVGRYDLSWLDDY